MSSVLPSTAVRVGADSGAGASASLLRAPRACLALVAAIALAAVLCASAFASSARAAGFYSVGQLFGNGADDTRVHQQRLAVQQSTGNILVTNAVSDQIDVYAPADSGGTLLTSFGAGELSDPFGIAVDQSTGNVYVSDAGNNRIARYTSDGAATPTYTADGSFTSPALGSGIGEVGSFAAAVAIDGASDKLLVADPGNNLVERFTLAGAYDGLSFDGDDSLDRKFTGLLDLAVDSTGDVIVVDSTGDIADGVGTSRVLRFSSAGDYEDQIGATLSRPATVGIRPSNDDVLVSSNQDAGTTFTTPLLDEFDRGGTAVGPIASSGVDISVVTGIALDDGVDGRLYVGTDVDRTSTWLGGFGLWSVQMFALQSAPVTASETAWNVLQTSARVGATIVTNGADTTYHFEYGTVGGGFTERTPNAVLIAALGVQTVSAAVSGLQPNTRYEFRIVADSGIGGPVVGAGGTFATYPLAPAATLAAVTDVSTDGATLHGTVDTVSAAGSYSFSAVEVNGIDRQETASVDLPAAAGQVAVSARLTGLLPGRTYAVGLYLHTAGGTVLADPVSFTTAGGTATPPPPRDPANPYGCKAPRLTGAGGAARRGQPLTLAGVDLGVYGVITFNGTPVEVTSYAADKVTVLVPKDAKGTVKVALECGHQAGLSVAIDEQPSLIKPKVSAPGSVRGTQTTLRVTLPGPGRVRTSGSGVTPTSQTVKKAGNYAITVKLSKRSRATLKRQHRAKVTVRVTYTSAGGQSATTTKTITFIQKAGR